MKPYDKINLNAEYIAAEIYKIIGDKIPSILLLLKWMEENFGLKTKVDYGDLGVGRSGFVFYNKSTNIHEIWLNSKESEYRQRFTLCHEVAHILRNRGLLFGFSTGNIYSAWGAERFCHRFAAAYLMPKDFFIFKWNGISNNDPIKRVRLSRLFKVSIGAVEIREKELGLTRKTA